MCMGPAFENRASTNPRGCGDGLWDFEFGSVVVMEKPAWLWRRRELGERDLRAGGTRIGIRPRLIPSTRVVILVEGVAGGIRRNGVVAA